MEVQKAEGDGTVDPGARVGVATHISITELRGIGDLTDRQ